MSLRFWALSYVLIGHVPKGITSKDQVGFQACGFRIQGLGLRIFRPEPKTFRVNGSGFRA